MSDFSISSRYAKAFYEIAEEKKVLEKISGDIRLIHNTLRDSKELRAVLQNPIISEEKKHSIIKELFTEKIDSSTQGFLDFVINKNREELLFGITKRFLELFDEHAGIVNADVTSAIELDERQKINIKKKLEDYTDKQVRLSFSLDKNLIGGFIVKIQDTVVDASIRHQLQLLKSKFAEGSLTFN